MKEPINGETLIDRSGLMYEVNGQKPYTGDVFVLFKTGNRKYSGRFKGGKQDGLWTYWDYNGQKEQEVNYKNGKQQLFRDVAEVVNVRRSNTMSSKTYCDNIIKAVIEQGKKVDDDYVIYAKP